MIGYLLENGTDVEYGARPLRRAVQRIFEDKLSDEIILGKIRTGSRIVTDIRDGEVVFDTKQENTNPEEGGKQ